MLGLFMYLCEIKKELLIGFSLTVLYITYYLVEVVKKPTVVCHEQEFRQFLEREVPLLSEPYWPTPWCIESWMQTVLGSLLRSWFLPRVRYRRQVVALSDGGQVALDWAVGEAGEGPGRAVVLVLPGLAGGAHADYVRCLHAAAAPLGARLVVYNYRGLGGIEMTSPRLYSAVSHEDLAEVVAAVRAACGDAPLLACGVSLGGLVLGQYLAAQGARAGVQAALAVSAPLDVEAGAACTERAPLLSWHMARAVRDALGAHALVRAQPGWAAARRARSLRQLDAALTAPHFGFGSADAYYRAATLRDKLRGVRVPLLCLCAADDPLQPRAALPVAEAEAAGRGGARVALAVTARGGHIGFLEGWWPAGAPARQFVARLAAQYFAALLRRPELLHRPSLSSCDFDREALPAPL